MTTKWRHTAVLGWLSVLPPFRLRSLLILTVLVAAACYWWIARPTILAQRFVAAVAAKDAASADGIIIGPYRKIVHSANDSYTVGEAIRRNFIANAKIVPRSWFDFVHCRRRIEVELASTTGSGEKSMVLLISTVHGVRLITGYPDWRWD